jgi:glycine oxidase
LISSPRLNADPIPRPLPATHYNFLVNIVVVGAGVVGCAIAHELASRGAGVRVLDPRGTGLGATRASAGMLAPYTEGHIAELRTLGVNSLALYDRFIERVRADSGEPVEYEHSGMLQVACNDGERAVLCAAARALAESGVTCELLDAAETARREPALAGHVVSALHLPDHGYVAASALTRALAASAVKHGATLTTARVLAIEAGDRGPRVVTADGAIEADAVVVAAGSWSDVLTDPLRTPAEPGARAVPAEGGAVKPIRGQLLQLRLSSPPVQQIIWGSRCYLVPWRDGTVLAGATVEDVGFDETATAAGVQQLLASSAELIPALRDAVFEEVRVGLRPMTRDELPVIGPSSTMRNVFYATGHYRNGVLLAPLTAALVASLVLDGRERPELALTRPSRLGL